MLVHGDDGDPVVTPGLFRIIVHPLIRMLLFNSLCSFADDLYYGLNVEILKR